MRSSVTVPLRQATSHLIFFNPARLEKRGIHDWNLVPADSPVTKACDCPEQSSAIHESMKVDGRVSQGVRRAGQRTHGSISRHRRQSHDGSPLTANSRNQNPRPNELSQTT